MNGQNAIHPIEIAGMVCPNNVFLAPMAGYTNYPFRLACTELGAGLTFTEMVSSKGLAYGSEATRLLLLCGGESPKAVQIFGSDPALMRAACESEALAPFDLVDINMGCPMPKIVKNGDGSALMETPALAEKIISSCVKSGKRISVKFRIGIHEGDECAAEFAKLCEGAGASFLSVHGRVRDKIYAGEVNYGQIAAAKSAVRIPVAANGGIVGREDVERMADRTGADAFLIARAALFHPRLFAELTGTPMPSILTVFLTQLKRTRALYGDAFTLVFMRKIAAFYLKGKRGAAEKKRKLFSASSVEEVEKLATEYLAEDGAV